jgi:GH24 family phage-related lysozyme (muramidase)
MKISQKGLQLIKDFEGLELKAYVCPAGVLTIGYGSTGSHVKPGMTITPEEAEVLLQKDLGRFEEAVNRLVKVPLTQGQYDALVSFAFNCGTGAFAESTLLRLLNEKDYTGAANQFKRWTNDGLEGLVRRRKAEETLFLSDTKMAEFDSKKFFDFAQYANPANPKHRAAYDDLYAKIKALDPSLLTDEANWVRIYRTQPAVGPVLNVPYYSQRDNYRDATRTCFSSSCAMLCEFLKPGTLAGAKGDDKYIEYVFSIGDSTDAAVQVQTLKHFGVSSRFETSGTFNLLDSQLAAGIPIPIGILHHGPASAPSGGGHWICVIGKEGENYIVNDPWGEIDNATGTYISENGNHLKYSKNLLKARWTVEGDGSGWAIIAKKG